jgi:hypothetical protein
MGRWGSRVGLVAVSVVLGVGAVVWLSGCQGAAPDAPDVPDAPGAGTEGALPAVLDVPSSSLDELDLGGEAVGPAALAYTACPDRSGCRLPPTPACSTMVATASPHLSSS